MADCRQVTLSRTSLEFLPGTTQDTIRVYGESNACRIQVSSLVTARESNSWAWVTTREIVGSGELTVRLNPSEYQGRAGGFRVGNRPLAITQWGTAPGPYGACAANAIQMPAALTINSSAQTLIVPVTAPAQCRYTLAASGFISALDPLLATGIGNNRYGVPVGRNTSKRGLTTTLRATAQSGGVTAQTTVTQTK